MNALGRIPSAGDKFEKDGLSATVLKMNGRRIDNIRLVKLAVESEEDED